jgi:8-oxo-dGTP pyrophosphatase MutT (NUDIX family)
MDAKIITVRVLDCAFQPRGWDWAEAEAERIEAHWARLKADKPALYDGPVLLLHRGEVVGDTFQGAYLQTRFSRFIAWRDFGFPDASMRNCFAMAALRAEDGAFLLGVMGPHTANAGKVYFPAGTPDPSDIVGDRVDLAGSVARELAEETGLDVGSVRFAEDWTLVPEGPRVACMLLTQAPGSAEEVRERILAFLAAEAKPELADIRIVRRPEDIDPETMPGFIQSYLRSRLRPQDHSA